MKHTSLWPWAGFALTTLGGTILHFLYDWTKGSLWVSPFSGVNESTWEHMKLLYWPLIIFAMVQWRFWRDVGGFWAIKLVGTLAGLVLIPVLFYTYNGVIGKSPEWINIVIFFVSAAIAYWHEAKTYRRGNASCRAKKRALAALCVIALLFVFFTFKTPTIGIFADPITGTYGR